MLRIPAIAALLAAALFAQAHAQDQARLRQTIVAAGPAVTLGDLFENAGEAAGRALAPAPPAGQSTSFSPRFVAAAAAAAGLDWSAPEGLEEIRVSRSGARTAAGGRRSEAPAALIRRGDAVSLVYAAPGLRLSTRGRALDDAALGQPVRIVNLQSNLTVDAVATGPGAASALPGR
jgi:hypothetical protein